MWMAILKYKITEKFSKKPKKLLKTNGILNPNNKLSGGPSFTFSLQEVTIRPSSSSR